MFIAIEKMVGGGNAPTKPILTSVGNHGINNAIITAY